MMSPRALEEFSDFYRLVMNGENHRQLQIFGDQTEINKQLHGLEPLKHFLQSVQTLKDFSQDVSL